MTRLVALDIAANDAFVAHVIEIWASGAAVLPLDQRLSHADRSDLLQLLGAHEVIDSSGLTGLTHGRELEPGDALVIATSGSTGAPKEEQEQVEQVQQDIAGPLCFQGDRLAVGK